MIIEDAPASDAEAADEVELQPEQELLAVLRESVEDANAGRVVSARQVLKEIAARHNLPLEPGE